MEFTLIHNQKSFNVDLASATCLAIPYDYNGRQPNFYDVPKGEAKPLITEGFNGQVNGTTGCDVMVINQNIHCTGTHTECAGHIRNENIFIHNVLSPGFILTELISVTPVKWSETEESYHCPVDPEEWVITKEMIQRSEQTSTNGLVIRTLPNSEEKLTRTYKSANTPFFTTDSVEYINELGVCHLVVDLPTIDKYDDGGQLGNHHEFFEEKPPFQKTITELAYIPESLNDGQYFMEIEIPAMQLDAAPSRPFLFNFVETL